MEDPSFQVVITQYLEQPCPLMGMAPVLGRLFGKNSTKLETYGVHFAMVALPGQGHSTLHNQLHSTLQAIMKLGGVQSQLESMNFLIDKIREPHGSFKF